MRKILAVLLLLSIGALIGCGLTLGPVAERETTWAKMGTPCRIVDSRKIEILVPDGLDEKGLLKWKRSTGVLAGMTAIDEPTLEYYRELDRKFGAK